MNRSRRLCKTAVFALLWAILTTPISTLSLLHWADQSGGSWSQWINQLPFFGRAVLVAIILIGPPLFGLSLASRASTQIHSAWNPMSGDKVARAAMTIGMLSTFCALIVFLFGLF